MKDKILSMTGMAKRAGKISAGSFGCEQSIKSGAARLVIIASDASENTRKSITDSCRFYKVPFIEYSNMISLGRCIGTDERAVISVNDNNFASAISDRYNQSFREM